jgi:hypothetical protein
MISLQGSTHQPITEIEKLATLSQDEGLLRLDSPLFVVRWMALREKVGWLEMSIPQYTQ